MVENYVQSPEDEALMKRVREEATIESAERSKRIEEMGRLQKEREALQDQIFEIDRKLADFEQMV